MADYSIDSIACSSVHRSSTILHASISTPERLKKREPMSTKKIVLIVVAVVSVLALLAAIFVGGIVGFAFYQIGNSQAAAKARDFLRNNEKLKTDIGEVKDFGSIVSGNVRVVDNSGEATVNLKVIGERQTVDASV